MRFLIPAFALAFAACGYHTAGHGDLMPKTIKSVCVPAFKNASSRYKLTDRLPEAITREFIARTRYSIVSDCDTADAVLRAARGAERTLVSGVSLFDVYAGEKLPEGKKSLAIEVVFQPRERTLTDAEIEAACAKVAAAVEKATGGRLR